MSELKDDAANLVGKLTSFMPVKKSFTNDDGQVVEYNVFVATAVVDGEEYTFDCKVKNFSDKLQILRSAEDVE